MKSLLFFLGLGLALAGCGSSEDDDDDGAGGSDGTAASGTGAAGVGGAGGAPGSGVPIPCGPGLTCVGGQACCIPLSEDPVAPTCASSCPTDPHNMPVSCLGSADCDGMACCGTALFGYECTTVTSCDPTMQKQMCLEDSDCPSNDCLLQTVQTVEIGLCQQ